MESQNERMNDDSPYPVSIRCIAQAANRIPDLSKFKETLNSYRNLDSALGSQSLTEIQKIFQ